MNYKTMIKRVEPKYRPLVEMCIDTISEYRNGALGAATIDELERVMNKIVL